MYTTSLRTKMVIYEIVNKQNGNVYVGQTIMARPARRWEYHRWTLNHQRHINPHLQNAWNKYGEASFEFNIVDTAETLEELNRLETSHIQKYRKLGKAYNMTDGGDNAKLSPKSKKKLSKSLKKWYLDNPIKEWGTVISPKGEEIEITSMTDFCERYKVRRDRMKALFMGEVYQHRGWTLKTPIKTCRKIVKRKGIKYKLTTPDGTVYNDIGNLKQFCRDNNIDFSIRFLLYSYNRLTKFNNWKLERLYEGKSS